LLAWQGDVMSVKVGDTSVHASSGQVVPHLAGHRDGCPPGYTVCPGETFYAALPALRDTLVQRQADCPASQGHAGDFFVSERSVNRNRAFPGDSIRVAATQYYVGRADTLQCSLLAYFLSSDCQYDAGDLRLGQDSSLLSEADYFKSESRALRLPDTVQPGQYYVLFVADAAEAWVESDERNNLTCQPLFIQEERTAPAATARAQGPRVWPNPFGATLQLALPAARTRPARWRITDCWGRTVAQGSLAAGPGPWTLRPPSALSPGAYYLHVSDGRWQKLIPLRKE